MSFGIRMALKVSALAALTLLGLLIVVRFVNLAMHFQQLDVRPLRIVVQVIALAAIVFAIRAIWRIPNQSAASKRLNSTGRSRYWPAVLGLLFIAPWIGEFLLGNISIREVMALPFLVPLYGGGALLIREVVRRTGRGWPAIIFLAAAYGVIEAGLVDQSLFNPTYEEWHFQEVTPIPMLGISAINTIVFVVGHVVWSIGIPIALMEMLSPVARRTTPWLRKGDLVAVALLYIGGCALIFQDLQQRENFIASSAQMIGAALVAAALIVTACMLKKKRSQPSGAKKVPSPRQLLIGAFVAEMVFTFKPETWVGVVMAIVYLGVVAALIAHWARQRVWTLHHQWGFITGALLSLGVFGFLLNHLERPGDIVSYAGSALFMGIAIGILIAARRAAIKSSLQN